MTKQIFISIAYVLSLTAPNCFAQNLNINILDLGAKADTNFNATHYIQQAIDSCYFNDGGTVQIPKGDFLIGTIVLKSNTTLQLDSGARILASRNIQDYRMPLDDATKPVLIYANGAKNIGIVGKGTIDGRAKRKYLPLKKVDPFISDITAKAREAGVEMKRYYKVKPYVGLVNLVNCQKITLREFTARESCFWTIHLAKSNQIHIDGLKVYSSLEKGVNADGIDINSCTNATIKNCKIYTGDDAIVIKSRYFQKTENIYVTDCELSSSSTALKIGTETRGDCRNVVFENCEVKNSNRGLSIVVMDGGHVSNVEFKDITIECQRRHFNWWGNGDPIWLYVGKRYPNDPLGSISNIRFENISATGMGTSKIESSHDSLIQGVHMSNLSLKMKAENYADKRSDHAFAVRNTIGLTLDNLSISWDDVHTEPQWKSGLYLDNVRKVKSTNISVRQGLLETDAPAIHLNNNKQSDWSAVTFEKGTRTGVLIDGSLTKDVTIELINSGIPKPFEFTSATKKNNTINVIML